ncbi:MAG: hypothetical protein Q9159_000274 [Coniocarpon cinnabarinum]
MPPPSTSPANSLKSDQASIRANRRRIAELVKNDFTYPSTLFSAANANVSGEPAGKVAKQSLKSYCIDAERVNDWQEYYFTSSDPSSEEADEEDEDEGEIVMKAALALEDEHRRLSEQQANDGEGLGEKLRRKRRSLLSHLRPSDATASGGSAPTSPTSPHQSQSSPNTETSQEDFQDDDSSFREKVAQEEKAALARKKQERKKRRRRRLADERAWNPGLDFWMRRRDAWCCARAVHHDSNPDALAPDDARSQRRSVSSADMQPRVRESSSPPQSTLEQLRLNSASPRSESPPRSATPLSNPSTLPHSRSPNSSGTALTSPDRSDSHLPHAGSPSPEIIQIPHTKSLLPSNDPSRSQIHNTRAYGAIYSKVIIQGLTPSVPINLKVMTHALVQGWKQEGEWPPRNADPEPSVRAVTASQRDHYSVMGRGVRRGKEKLRERRAAKKIV